MTDAWKGLWGRQELHVARGCEHNTACVDGSVHTNTIEGFWSLLKRAWYGSHHPYGIPCTLLYIAEACWTYNERKNVGPLQHLQPRVLRMNKLYYGDCLTVMREYMRARQCRPDLTWTSFQFKPLLQYPIQG